MENSFNSSESSLKSALSNLCSDNADEKTKKQSLNYLTHFTNDKKLMLSLLSFIMDEEEDLHMRKYAWTYLIKCIERVNALVRPMLHILFHEMHDPAKRSTLQKAFFIFLENVIDSMHNPSHRDSFNFIVNLMMKYLNSENDVQLHELGAIILHALFKNMGTTKMLPHADNIAAGLQIILKKSKNAIERNSEKAYVLLFHGLMCATILGQNMSRPSLVTQPFNNSLKDMLDLIKFIAQYGAESHFHEVAELMRILLKSERISGRKWAMAFATVRQICRQKKYPEFARIKAHVVLGNVVAQRARLFGQNKIFEILLVTVIRTICEKPESVPTNPKESEQKLPTPMSTAADLLHFIALNFDKDEVCDTVLRILLSLIKRRKVSEWQFRGSFICLARISKTCAGQLNQKYSKELIVFFKAGFVDSSEAVRLAASYALYKLLNSEHLECSCWMKSIFSTFLMSMMVYTTDVKIIDDQNPLSVEINFSLMKIFCEVLNRDLIPYLPKIMKICLFILEHVKCDRIINCAIELLQKTVFYVGQSFLPYLCEVVEKLTRFIVTWDVAEYIEIRPTIVDLLTYIVLYSSKVKDVRDIYCHRIIRLVYNILQMQHARTQFHGASLEILLLYSTLRCSIFRFVQEVSAILPEEILPYIPKMVGTLLGTVTAIKYFSANELEFIAIIQKRPDFLETSVSYCLKKEKYFKLSGNNEIETATISIIFESFTLNDEVQIALIVLENLIENSVVDMTPYIENIFLKLSQTCKYANIHLRKQILYTLNFMMELFLDNFPYENSNFLDQSFTEFIDLLGMETDSTIISECVNGFLHYVAITEKHIELDHDVHMHLCNLMKELFQTIAELPQDDQNRRSKDNLLNQIIEFMPKLSSFCKSYRFKDYFSVYLIIFESKVNMPLYRSVLSDQNRGASFGKLIEGFNLMDKSNAEAFQRCADLLIKGLNDPINQTRKNAAAGLGILVDHCDLQPVRVYKRLIKLLWKKSKREKNKVVHDYIWYGIVLIINRNIWQQPIQKLALQIIRILPNRHIFDYNMIMVEFFEKLCFERPSNISHVIKDIYKYLLKLLEEDLETDIDPLYKRTLSLAANLYSMHVEELRHITINPTTMQAIMSACKNRACLRAMLR